MIVNIEKLKLAKLSVGVTWSLMASDNYHAPHLLWLSDVLTELIGDIELCGESIIEVPTKGGGI